MPRFIIQRHNATTLHYDLRLEMQGVLKSWAIIKIPPRRKNLKRLAIPTPDHPLSYINFEGKIIEGYGKGTVKIWDKGTYKLISKNSKKIEFELNGKKLKGKYVLIFTAYRPKKNGWLFFKI
ncbi:MAG: DNA polymerase ligase N-terminal domain-containing protein [Nanoarchaeota archaeon]|nr:DNA polymerase ligase N-terminal domain-containing protein [Nanoarchaeota archaeon]